MTTIRIKLPTIEQIKFTLEAEQDDIPIRGNAMESGDDAFDKQCEDEITARLNRGDIWAWASVCVRAEWRGLEGTAYLGACCYKDEEDFKGQADYYDDMKQAAYEELIDKIKALK